VAEELQRIGANVHVAEPAETSALKGKKKRAKTDWADVRHHRELLLIGRLPESPGVRRHTPTHQRAHAPPNASRAPD
jgi:hypothetical protein